MGKKHQVTFATCGSVSPQSVAAHTTVLRHSPAHSLYPPPAALVLGSFDPLFHKEKQQVTQRLPAVSVYGLQKRYFCRFVYEFELLQF